MPGKLETTLGERVLLLRNVPSLAALDEQVLTKIAGAAELMNVARGEPLIKEGEDARTLYIVLKGRFVVLVGQAPIAEILTGEPIGELAFFAGGKRTATVIAARNSTVLCLSRSAYDALSKETPDLSSGILKALSERLARTISDQPELRPKVGKVCSVFPGGQGPMDPGFVAGLKKAFATVSGWTVLDADDCAATKGDLGSVTAWLESQEVRHGNLVVLCKDPIADPVWRKVAADNSDTVLIAVHKRSPEMQDAQPTALEKELLDATLPSNLQLVLYRTAGSESTRGSAVYLDERKTSLHHHVALDSPSDFARLGRFIRGEALGLVLCGGGSLGTAHLGAISAMKDRGFEFDYLGGTSVGSAMAAALSVGLDPKNVMDLCEDIFIKSKAMSRLTVPKHSLLDHHTLDAALARHYDGYTVEDAPMNFFAVATSLTHNDVRVIRSGPLWEAVRASASLPGIFPPFVCDDGEVLIDGGLLDNVPVTVMRELKAGPNLVLNFLPPKPWRVGAKYEDLPTRSQAVARLLKRKAKGAARHPTIMSTLSRAMVVNSRKLLQNIELGDDVLLNLPTIRGMSYLDWKRGRQLFDFAHDEMSKAMDQAEWTEADSPIVRLESASHFINGSV